MSGTKNVTRFAERVGIWDYEGGGEKPNELAWAEDGRTENDGHVLLPWPLL